MDSGNHRTLRGGMVKTPRYTDTRYQNGYRPSAQTDIRKTFARVRAEQKAKAEQDAANAAEAQVKVKALKGTKA